jgi:hypothetical protein
MELSAIEEEVVFLKAINEIIDSMVNFEMLTLHGTDPDSTVLFETSTHQRFFNIVLVDFLSRTDKKAPVKQGSYLGALRAISVNPSFIADDSVASLRKATWTFVNWLEQKVGVDVWLPSIDTQASIQISRLSFLKMCGDISKHNILRSVGVAEELQQTLETSGTLVELGDAMLALDDFYERFHYGHPQLPWQHDRGVSQQHSMGHLRVFAARVPTQHCMGRRQPSYVSIHLSQWSCAQLRETVLLGPYERGRRATICPTIRGYEMAEAQVLRHNNSKFTGSTSLNIMFLSFSMDYGS